MIVRILLPLQIIMLLQSMAYGEQPYRAKGESRRMEIKDIQSFRYPGYTRVIITLNREPVYRLNFINTPPSIHIDIKNATLSPSLKRTIPVNDGRLKEIETLKGVKDNVRLVISVEEGMGQNIYYEEKETARIVIDISQINKATKENVLVKGSERSEGTPGQSQLPGAVSAISKDEIALPSARNDTVDRSSDESQAPEKAKRAETFNLSGYIKNETAYRLSEPGEFTKVKNIFFLRKTGSLSADISYKVSGRLFYDAIFDLTDNYPEAVRKDQEFEGDIRDTYLDISGGDLDLRIGKQQIVWGEAVGLFFADVVNAKDLREFVLPDFDYIRIPQWATDIEYTKGHAHLEFVWIPLLEFNKLGVPVSEFSPSAAIPQGVMATSRSIKEPSDSLKNSETGARASYLTGGWDLSVFHLYTWDKFPVNLRTIVNPSLYTFHPEHRRLNISGFTFAKEVSDIILKGEFIYNNGKYFSVLDKNDMDGVVKRDYIDYLLGIDYTLFERVDLNVQFMQRVISDYEPTIFREAHISSSASIWLKTGFLENTIEPEIFFVSDLKERDMMVRPRVNFKFRENWQTRIGADIFGGGDEGIFGQFNNRDRIYGEVRYDF